MSLLVMIAVPETHAEALASTLVKERLAACVQATPVRSMYRWEGAVQQSAEVLLLVKTVGERYPDLETRVRELHPYEVPEMTALAIDRMLPQYSEWLMEATKL